jgi:hypothetical protein
VLNGAGYHGGDPDIGDDVSLDSAHWLHGAELRFDSPTVKGWGIGAQYTSFTRESHYKITFPNEPALQELQVTQLLKQTNPELKIFLTYFPSR